MAFDQRTSIPARWSLRPEETLGLIFWTKSPANLLADAQLLKDYRVKVHATVTGWGEVEKGAPGLREGGEYLQGLAKAFGPENVTWRFTPVPVVPDVVDRFRLIANMASDAGVQKVFLSFLQPNDWLKEVRSVGERQRLMRAFAEEADFYDIKVLLCQDDQESFCKAPNLDLGVCAPPDDFPQPDKPLTGADGCGCVFTVDPFTINESCTLGCQYCYAADESLSPKKRNTTRGLPVLQ